MVCFPYPKLMTARIGVDQAAAVLITSLDQVEKHRLDGHPIHVWGGAGAADPRDLLDRASYSRSPAMDAALHRTLDQAGVTTSKLALTDLYSCFPVVPKLASRSLGLAADAPMTATGSLTAFGGPGNNYSLHGVVSATRALRDGGGIGLVYGNGELVTKHHAALCADLSHLQGYVGARDQIEVPVQRGTEDSWGLR